MLGCPAGSVPFCPERTVLQDRVPAGICPMQCPRGDGGLESLKGPQAALSLDRQQGFRTGTALLVPNLHEKTQELVPLPPSLRRGLL